MSHHCHARGCEKAVPPEMLMCAAHWRRVPKHIRDAVWANYRNGQCDDKTPSLEWHVAADAAIGWVAKIEGRLVRVSEMEALKTSNDWR